MHSSSYSAAIWDDEEPRTLCDWVKNFRIKKIQMKRKLRSGGDLRVCAILSTALLSAEHELRRKQQERFNRWLEMQSRFDNKPTPPQPTTYVSRSCAIEQHLVNTAGSSSNNEYINNNHNNHRDEINNIWKCELNSLDEFMRNISSKSSSSKCGAANRNETLVFQNGDLQQQCDEIINSTSNSNCNSNLINTTTPNSIEVAS